MTMGPKRKYLSQTGEKKTKTKKRKKKQTQKQKPLLGLSFNLKYLNCNSSQSAKGRPKTFEDVHYKEISGHPKHPVCAHQAEMQQTLWVHLENILHGNSGCDPLLSSKWMESKFRNSSRLELSVILSWACCVLRTVTKSKSGLAQY